MSKKINDIRKWQKKMMEFCRLTEKDHVWKESGVTTQEGKEMEVVTLLRGNYKNSGTADKVLSYF